MDRKRRRLGDISTEWRVQIPLTVHYRYGCVMLCTHVRDSLVFEFSMAE